MADTRIKKFSWVAALALAVGGLAACGEEVVTDSASASRAEASRGSDQHLYNQSAEIASRNAAREAAQAEADRYVEGLESQAETIAATTNSPSYYPHGYDYTVGDLDALEDTYREASRPVTDTTSTTAPALLPGSHNVPN